MHPVNFRLPDGTEAVPQTIWEWIRGWRVVAFLSGVIWFLLRMLGGKFADEFKLLREEVAAGRMDMKAYAAEHADIRSRLLKLETWKDQHRRDHANGAVGVDWLD